MKKPLRHLGFLYAFSLAFCAHMPPAPTFNGVVMPVNFECWLHENDDGTGKCLSYRGGQPTKVQLAAMGVKSDVKLNLAVEGRDVLPDGVTEFDHPLSPVGPVDHEETLAVLFDIEQAARTPELHPFYTHCSHGADRTGYIIAVYRVRVQHVLPSAAWAEWRRFPRETTDKIFLYDDFERETGYHIPENER